MNKLPYKVECKSTLPFFELIAAFDCEAAAVLYAGDCSLGNPKHSYRVKYRGQRRATTFGPEG